MKFVMNKPTEVDVRYVKIQAAIRYDEEDMPNDSPMRFGEMWTALVSLDDRKVVNWPLGKTLDFCMKVCDEGVYTLYDRDMSSVAEIEGYVPNHLLPGEYGDYLSLSINEQGIITNWLFDANFDDFKSDNED